MYAILPRFLKRIYRKEPISSFILTIGLVDAVIGGVGEKWGLFSFGTVILFLAIAVRWWQTQQAQEIGNPKTPRRYLPPSSSAQALPILSHDAEERTR